MPENSSRREFAQAAAAASAFSIVPRHVLGGTNFVAPSDKITLAHIGMGTQSFTELGALLASPNIQIVAVCDPNAMSNDYVEWSANSIRGTIRRLIGNPNWNENGTGCTAGREVGKEVINAYYANQRKSESFKGVATYADFRELLDKEKDVNCVKIMTPDHLHATIGIAAMKKGLNVITHKPISNRMAEARLMIETARKTKTLTHFLPYSSGAQARPLLARINQGIIGKVREVHNWSARPMWPQYTEIPRDRPPVPKGLDWDLWLGPEAERPYHPHFTHAVFRGWYDFGGGSIADMGHYSLWPVFTALKLGAPLSAEAWSSHTCEIVNQVSRRVRNDFSFPAASAIRFRFPELELFWYDGGMRPRLPAEIDADVAEFPSEGMLYIGSDGAIMAGFNSQNPKIYPKSKQDLLAGLTTERRDDAARGVSPWLDAFTKGEESPGSFHNAAALSDAVNLGAIAVRTGKKVLFDSSAMKITNVAEANALLTRKYRSGWELS